jgi:Lrp/AsnC family transcriptional regulator
LETIDENIYVIAENMKNIDNTDRKILQALQTDCSGSVSEIADRAGVSQTPCWRRIKRLEETDYITRRVALLNARKLNLGLTAFILIKAARHHEESLIQFASGVSKIPEVLEIHRMAGEIDYLLKIVAADVDDYDRIYKSLIKVVDLSDVSASFSIESIKSTTVLPLHVS